MTQKKIYFFLLSALFIIAACKKSNHNPPDVFNATVDSFNYQGIKITATLSNNLFAITSYDKNDTNQLALSFSSPVILDSAISGDVTYFQPKGPFFWYSNTPPGSSESQVPSYGHSSITITSWDSVTHRIAGTFASEMYTGPYDSLSQTNGTFNVTVSIH